MEFYWVVAGIEEELTYQRDSAACTTAPVGQDEMTEGFAVFDIHPRAGMETATPLPNGKRRFESGSIL
ncbi:MAG: hypothetical protein WA691_04330 [Thermoplasmata archaeon]